MRSIRHVPGMPGRGRQDARGRRLFASAAFAVCLLAALPASRAAENTDQMTIGVHVSLAPTWFDPAETAGIITPYMIMYAMHDALAKPMPEANPAPSLATSWKMAPDGLSYDFVIRQGVKFHDGSTMTADDVSFSFNRYRGAGAKLMKSRVASVEIP